MRSIISQLHRIESQLTPVAVEAAPTDPVGPEVSPNPIIDFLGGPQPIIGDLDPVTTAIIWLHADISQWAQTSTVTGISITGSQVCIFHTKAGQWPVFVNDGTAAEGNPWVFANIGGLWYGGTFEWLRPGQECKGVTRDDIGLHVKQSPFTSWVPQVGEVVGFAMSTRARDAERTSDERSDIVLVEWPY